VELTAANQRALQRLMQRHCDAGVQKLFAGLASTLPQFRLSRNLREVLGHLARRDFSYVLNGGLSAAENSGLQQLEKSGITLELLGVAHSLLNVRERQDAIVAFHDAFFEARRKKSS
jgi:hypothetical protein